jgi:hypothetical protein
MARKRSKKTRSGSTGSGSPLLTPAELAALDVLIKDMEKRPGARADAGLLPTIITGFTAIWVVRWLVVRAFVEILLRKILGGGVAGRDLTEAQMREAEAMLVGEAAPSLEDLKAVRARIRKRGKQGH